MLHVPEGVGTSDALCIGGVRIVDVAANELSKGAKSGTVVRAQLASDGKTVDVVVGGGRAQLKLGRCL